MKSITNRLCAGLRLLFGERSVAVQAMRDQMLIEAAQRVEHQAELRTREQMHAEAHVEDAKR